LPRPTARSTWVFHGSGVFDISQMAFSWSPPGFSPLAVAVEVFPGDFHFLWIKQLVGTDLGFRFGDFLVEYRRLQGAVRHADQFRRLFHVRKVHVLYLHL
jgi:hypothetical protein